MKQKLTIIILGLSCLFFSGCATASSGTQSDATLLQVILDKMLPADFAGPIELSHQNQYFTFVVRGGNVRKNASGQWSWEWLEYERSSHFPIFSGLQWSSSGKIRLGQTK